MAATPRVVFECGSDVTAPPPIMPPTLLLCDNLLSESSALRVQKPKQPRQVMLLQKKITEARFTFTSLQRSLEVAQNKSCATIDNLESQIANEKQLAVRHSFSLLSTQVLTPAFRSQTYPSTLNVSER